MQSPDLLAQADSYTAIARVCTATAIVLSAILLDGDDLVHIQASSLT